MKPRDPTHYALCSANVRPTENSLTLPRPWWDVVDREEMGKSIVNNIFMFSFSRIIRMRAHIGAEEYIEPSVEVWEWGLQYQQPWILLNTP